MESVDTLMIGVLLIAALAGGQFAIWLRLPKVTAYLLVGLLLGPHTLRILPEEHLHHLLPVGDMAMALVLFNMGSHFSLSYFRRIFRRALWLSFGELVVTFVLVAVGMYLATWSWQAAVLFAALALATAPATTILVLKENESEGPLTEYTYSLVALNNLAAVILFEGLFVVVGIFSESVTSSIGDQLVLLFTNIFSSLALGVVAGLVVSYACAMLPRNRWLVLLIGISTLVLGGCGLLEIPYLLTFLAMGTTLANASERTASVTEELDHITGLLCVIFFVVHGAEMDLQSLYLAGAAGVVYIVTRSIGKYVGVYLTADRKHNLDIRRWLGAALLSQAGAAIAMAAIAVDRAPELGRQLQTIILGTVVFFEIIGPLLIRRAVVASGEVPLHKAIRHQSTTPLMELKRLVNRLQLAIGVDPWRKQPPDRLTVREFMRTTYDTIRATATFDEMISVLEHGHDNVFPVIGLEGQFMGVIRYEELRDAVFDPKLGRLVFAADLAQSPDGVLQPDAPITDAWNLVQSSKDDLLPVMASDGSRKLLGVVARQDIYRFLLKNADL